MLIKAVLIAAVLVVGATLIRGQGARRQALRRLGLLVFAVAAVVSILQPDLLTWAARKINVGRGADLLLYALIVVFFSYVVTRHLRDARTVDQITALARRVALNQAPPPRETSAAVLPPGREPSAAPGETLGSAPEGEADGLVPGGGAPGRGSGAAGGRAASGDGQDGPAR
ncbi:MAG: DUF2304 domain-containing protein [Bifidobacteriaceae bacterium]|jgi:hypothetical protein|nr:DUF2304 domain-containing protein [Bifidobacteriaceae bacterium]